MPLLRTDLFPRNTNNINQMFVLYNKIYYYPYMAFGGQNKIVYSTHL